MNPQKFINPFFIFFLITPFGISSGFVSIALPYQLIQNGFSVGQTAAVVAVGASASMLRFVFGPIVDTTLSLRKWYIISLLASIGALLVLATTPFTIKGITLLTIIVFISQIASNFLFLPVSGFMAKSIEERRKGLASGCLQGGMLLGTGAGGGAGLWLLTHYGSGVSGIIMCAISVALGAAVFLIPDVKSSIEQKIQKEMLALGTSLFAMLKVPVVLFIIILILAPIGSGGASNLWSAVAQDWKTDANTVALVTGVLNGLMGFFGCLAGGLIVDRWGVWVSYFVFGALCALVTFLMALLPMQPLFFIIGVSVYAFCLGLSCAGFTAIILFATGKKHAATKYSLISSLGNLPVVLMIAFDGFTHDKFNSRYMLIGEAAIGLLFVLIFYFGLQKMRNKNLILDVIE